MHFTKRAFTFFNIFKTIRTKFTPQALHVYFIYLLLLLFFLTILNALMFSLLQHASAYFVTLLIQIFYSYIFSLYSRQQTSATVSRQVNAP